MGPVKSLLTSEGFATMVLNSGTQVGSVPR